MAKRTTNLHHFQTVNCLIVLMDLDERYAEMSADDMSEEAGEPITEEMMNEARAWVNRRA